MTEMQTPGKAASASSSESVKKDAENGGQEAQTLSGFGATWANIVKNTCGSGLLFLPGALYNAKMASGVAVMLIGMGLSTYSLYIIGISMSILGVENYRDAMVITGGKRWGKFLGNWVTIGMIPFLAPVCMSYAVTMAKMASNVFELSGSVTEVTKDGKLTKQYFGDMSQEWVSFWIIPVLGAICLCLTYFKYLRFLKWSSYIGIAAVFGTIFVVFAKGCASFINGTAGTIDFLPSTGAQIMKMFPALNMMAAAACNQYNGGQFYNSMEDKSKWGSVVFASMGTVAVLYMMVSIMGAYAFAEPKALILENFMAAGTPAGTWKTLGLACAFATAFSLMGSFPLVFSAVRGSIDQVAQMLGSTEATKSGKGWNISTCRRIMISTGGVVTIILVAMVCCVTSMNAAYMLMDLSQILIGNMFSFVFPAMMYKKAKKNKSLFDKAMIWTLIIMGVICSILGLLDMCQVFKVADS